MDNRYHKLLGVLAFTHTIQYNSTDGNANNYWNVCRFQSICFKKSFNAIHVEGSYFSLLVTIWKVTRITGAWRLLCREETMSPVSHAVQITSSKFQNDCQTVNRRQECQPASMNGSQIFSASNPYSQPHLQTCYTCNCSTFYCLLFDASELPTVGERV